MPGSMSPVSPNKVEKYLKQAPNVDLCPASACICRDRRETLAERVSERERKRKRTVAFVYGFIVLLP